MSNIVKTSRAVLDELIATTSVVTENPSKNTNQKTTPEGFMIIWEIIDLNIRMGKFVVWYLHTYLYIGTTCRMLARCHKKPSESVNQRGAPQLSLCKSCFKTGSWRIQRPLYWPSFPILNSFHGGASSELAQYTKEVKKVEIEVMKMISSKAKTI